MLRSPHTTVKAARAKRMCAVGSSFFVKVFAELDLEQAESAKEEAERELKNARYAITDSEIAKNDRAVASFEFDLCTRNTAVLRARRSCSSLCLCCSYICFIIVHNFLSM